MAEKVAVKPAKKVAENLVKLPEKVPREAFRTVEKVGKVAEKAVHVTEHVVKEVVVKPVNALSEPLIKVYFNTEPNCISEHCHSKCYTRVLCVLLCGMEVTRA